MEVSWSPIAITVVLKMYDWKKKKKNQLIQLIGVDKHYIPWSIYMVYAALKCINGILALFHKKGINNFGYFDLKWDMVFVL